MQIRTRLTLRFTVLTGTILLAFALFIWLSAWFNREQAFYKLLEREAITKANLFFQAGVDSAVLHDIYRRNREVLDEVEVAIYDRQFRLLYHDAADIDLVKETPELVQEIVAKGGVAFYVGKWQVVGMVYTHDDDTFVITAAAHDQHGWGKLEHLLTVILLAFFIVILLIYAAGRYMSASALQPIKHLTDRAARISVTNLHLRLEHGMEQDELTELAATFNQLLQRLEQSFEGQKQFVSHISHELRTPLFAMMSELALALSTDRSVAAYRATIDHALNDAKRMERLLNSLLDFAKASYDAAQVAFSPLRLDELLLDARQQVVQAHPEWKIALHISPELEERDEPIIHGNAYLLRTAFANLMDNGCKFSKDFRMHVTMESAEGQYLLTFSDEGIGMSAEDLEQAFQPFFRGANAAHAEGYGIGLSLTQRIILLHQGRIWVTSVQGQGTQFNVVL